MPKVSKWWQKLHLPVSSITQCGIRPVKTQSINQTLIQTPTSISFVQSVERNIFECGYIHYIHGSLKDCGAVEIPKNDIALRFSAAILKWMIILFNLDSVRLVRYTYIFNLIKVSSIGKSYAFSSSTHLEVDRRRTKHFRTCQNMHESLPLFLHVKSFSDVCPLTYGTPFNKVFTLKREIARSNLCKHSSTSNTIST